MNTADMLNIVWPLAFILVFLVALRQFRNDARPIIGGIITGLSANATRNATQYAIAIGFGLSASLSAFYDVFNDLTTASLAAISWHQYAALWAKIANPFIVAVLAYATQSNFKKPDGGTNPPFTPATPP